MPDINQAKLKYTPFNEIIHHLTTDQDNAQHGWTVLIYLPCTNNQNNNSVGCIPVMKAYNQMIPVQDWLGDRLSLHASWALS